MLTPEADRDKKSRADSRDLRRSHAVLKRAAVILTAAGVLAVVYQLWGYIGWLLSDDFVTTPPGPDPIDAKVKASLVQTQLILSLFAIGWTAVLIVQWRKARKLTWPLLSTIAWASVYWQDPLVNWRGYHFSYNAYLVNRGDWVSHLPFVSHQGPMATQPLLVEALVFYSLLPALGLLTYAIMRFAHRRLRIKSPAVLVIIAWAAIFAFDAGFEILAIHQHMHAWTSVFPPLSIHAGTPEQWPVYEGVFLGVLWGLGGMLMYFRGQREFTVLDDALPTMDEPSWSRAAIQIFSMIGLYNIMFLAYNVALNALAQNSAIFPSWLAV